MGNLQNRHYTMKTKNIQIDFSGLTKQAFHQKMKELLGFPDFYGMNWDAMIDSLSYMRQPEAGMSEITLGTDDMLVIDCKNITRSGFELESFLEVIQACNERELNVCGKSLILLNIIP